MKRKPPQKKIVVLSGSGVSAESGLPTYRDAGGLWRTYAWRDLASVDAWERHPEVVLEFYNERRVQAWQAKPNAAHYAIASLESAYRVVVITQNVDALHERAGSRHVIHLHGELAYVRGTSSEPLRYRIDADPIHIGQRCERGTQLRPDVVWFGENVPLMNEAQKQFFDADKVLVVGTSLSVYPAAGLTRLAPEWSEKVLISPEIEKVPVGFEHLQGKAGSLLPDLALKWIKEERLSRSL